MTNHITLPRTLANRLLTLAQSQSQAEVCGLIGRTDDNLYQVYPVENIASNPEQVFEMAPQQQIDAFRQMREQQQTLFAIYHSHPHSPASPSRKDLDEAGYDSALNLIISLDTTGVLDMRGYYYQDDRACPVDLAID